MIDFDTALGHHLLELPIADRIGHIPSDAPEHDIALELAAFEIDHGCCTSGLFPVSLLALGKPSKFATEPDRVHFTREPQHTKGPARLYSTVEKKLAGYGLESGRREELKEWFAAAVKILMTSRNLPKEL